MALLEAHGLHKRFGDHVVLENISLAFPEGQLSGIMGPNGAGKTTCFNVLTGGIRPDRGRVLFDGEDITGLPPHAIARRGVARSFQLMNVFDEYTALENVLLAAPAVRARSFDMLHDLRRDTRAQDTAAAVLASVGLHGKEHVPDGCPTATGARSRSAWPSPPSPAYSSSTSRPPASAPRARRASRSWSRSCGACSPS
jgi:branched-chain amino acid transport system ATP-binding protein